MIWLPLVYSLSDYAYALPEALIAQRPAEPRDSSRLMVLDRARGCWEHRRFSDLPEYLDSRDLMVANNTRVLKARLLGRRVLEGVPDREELGGRVEFLLLEEIEDRVWEGAFHASVKHKPGVRFRIPTPDGRGLYGTLIRGASDSPHGTVVAEFDRDPVSSGAGMMPLPHYIKREESAGEAADEVTYQTYYAKPHAKGGSAAAPTAGLHFTPGILQALQAKGVGWEEVTLSVGLGTFRPVKSEDIRLHRMHEERFEIPRRVADRVNEAKRAKWKGQRIVAVGTTSARTLESAWIQNEGLKAGAGRTSIFIYPGGPSFQVVDRMITNFHLPKSTLLMLVCAFAGRELVLSAYEEAVREKYRFFSYGDAMLLL